MALRDRTSINILIILAAGSIAYLSTAGLLTAYKKYKLSNLKNEAVLGTEVARNEPGIFQQPAEIDTREWKTYHDKIYLFDVKYPENWTDPKEERITDPDFAYEYKVTFGTQESLNGNGTQGFSIFVYKTDACNTSIQSKNLKSQNFSSNNNGSSPMATLDITQTSPCSTHRTTIPIEYRGGYYHEFSSKLYTYALMPLSVNAGNASGNASSSTIGTMPVFEAAVKTFSFNSQINPGEVAARLKPLAPVPPAPKATSTPVSQQRKGTVCPVKNDRPGISSYKQNHMDEDCCPDYDEWPNPACYYTPTGYAIMLKGPAKGHIKKSQIPKIK